MGPCAIGIGVLLLTASGAAAQPGMPSAAATAARPPLLPPAAATTGPSSDLETSPLMDAGRAHVRYRAKPSGLDRFDPANMRIFGAEIGGEGVKDGAVVSLTWPTEPR